MRTITDERRVIVIGSGPAGAMAALTLLKQGIPVTMLESGRRLPPGLLVRVMGRNVFRRRPSLTNQQRHVSSGDPKTVWYNDLVPGGLSNYWTGAVPRFAPEDFVEGERLHERYRWPVSYEDLAPYYDQVEGLLGVVGDPSDVPNLPAGRVAHQRRLPSDWRRVAAHAASYGHGLTPIPLADGPSWMLRRTGTAFNSFARIVRTLQRSPHFQLLLGAHALRLEWSGATRRVTSVVYFDRVTRSEERVTGAAVVVAAGALASTKLLLQSACPDFPTGLGDTEGLLGRYLHDHPHDMVVVDVDRPLTRLGHAAYLTRSPYQEAAPLLAAGCTLRERGDRPLDRVLSFAPVKAKTFSALVFGTMIPVASNAVTLSPAARDVFGQPVLDIHLCYDAEVARNTAAAKERLLAILASAGYRCTVRWSLDQLTPGSSVHYGGTIRMHRSPKHGMLNAWNRLHAVDNVVVADASCFTTGVEKNPALTVMALSARAAARLADDLTTSSLTAFGRT